MAAHLLEWLELAVRWLHVVAAIAWVGASFYFIWVENALSRGGEQRTSALAGHLWSIHGGGFYYLEKYKGAPPALPPKLHWFKWEAYTAWLSGAALLVLVYHLNAATWLAVADSAVSPGGAIAVSIALIIGGWLGYDLLCRTPLLKHPLWMTALGLFTGVALVYLLNGVLVPRASFLHLGAVIGTIMAGNVLFIIIPAQKKLVAAAMSGNTPDLRPGHHAALRSLHNNYLALPAVFLMIGAHYPVVYQHAQSGVLFVALSAAGGFVRHFINCKNRGTPEWKWLAIAAVCFGAAVLLTLPPSANRDSGIVTTSDIRPLMEQHCVSCHSASPTDAVFRTAPLGFVLDTEAQTIAAAAAIYRRVVVDRSMPFNNASGMTDAERQKIAAWHNALPDENR